MTKDESANKLLETGRYGVERHVIAQDIEDLCILLEAEMFEKVLTSFHRQATDSKGSECTFWNDMCGIRKEYLKKLEALDE